MKLLAKSYEEINRSTKAPQSTFLSNLKKEYDDLQKINLLNENNNSFYISPSFIGNIEKNFKDIVSKSINFREANKSKYLHEGYIVSEINSSLKAEGVNSTRRMTEELIKNRAEGKKLQLNEIERLIANYYDAIKFILSGNKISEENLYSLYRILTAGIEVNVLKLGEIYRTTEVFIGQDEGIKPDEIKTHINKLITFINSDELENNIHSKAIISHYAFENIHPYLDFNGRMGRLVHLWILKNKGFEYFWELTFLSESIYAFKDKFDKTYDHILKAKKMKANIDLNYFVYRLFTIFIKHTEGYIKMKQMVNELKVSPSRSIRLFIIDILVKDPECNRYWTIKDYKKEFPDYSDAAYGKILKEIRESKLFDIQEGNPLRFRLKKEARN